MSSRPGRSVVQGRLDTAAGGGRVGVEGGRTHPGTPMGRLAHHYT